MTRLKEYIESRTDENGLIDLPEYESARIDIEDTCLKQLFNDVGLYANYLFQQGKLESLDDEQTFLAGAYAVLASLGLQERVPANWLFSGMRGDPVFIEQFERPKDKKVQNTFRSNVLSAKRALDEAESGMQRATNYMRPYVGSVNPDNKRMVESAIDSINNAIGEIDDVIEWFQLESMPDIQPKEKVQPRLREPIPLSGDPTPMMAATEERLFKNIDTSRGVRSKDEFAQYIHDQAIEMNQRALHSNGYGISQIMGRMKAVGDVRNNGWSAERVLDELIKAHHERLNAGKAIDLDKYMELFGVCEGYCWAIKNEDNYQPKGM